jgi:hypothetical protein
MFLGLLDPDPLVRCCGAGSGSGSFLSSSIHSKKNLDFYCFVTFFLYDFLSLKNDENASSKVISRKTCLYTVNQPPRQMGFEDDTCSTSIRRRRFSLDVVKGAEHTRVLWYADLYPTQCCGSLSRSDFDVDADPAFYYDADPAS